MILFHLILSIWSGILCFFLSLVLMLFNNTLLVVFTAIVFQ
jgi:hypothetical protein